MTAPTPASLAAHLAAVHGLSATDAAAAVDAFVEDVYGQCLDRGAAVYPGLGTFRLAASGLAFAPDPALALVVNHRFAGLDAAPAARPEAPLPAFAPLVVPAPPTARPAVPVAPPPALPPVPAYAPPAPIAYAPVAYVPTTGYPPAAPPPAAPTTYAELPDDDTPAPRARLLPAVLVGLMLLLGAMAAYGWWTTRTPQPTLATAPPLDSDTSAATPPATAEPFEPTPAPPDTAMPQPAAPAPVDPSPAPRTATPRAAVRVTPAAPASPSPAPRTSAPRAAPADRPAARTAAARASVRPAPPRDAAPSDPAVVELEAGDAVRLTPPPERAALVGDAAVVPGAGGYTVVAGGAATMAMAERMADPLRVAGFRVAVLPGTTDGGRTIWRVCVGQFPDLGAATVALRRLRGDVLPADAWLLSLQSDRFRD